MMIALCWGCRFGRHEDHEDWPVKPPEGMFGGMRCDCKGDCEGNVPDDLEWLDIPLPKLLPGETMIEVDGEQIDLNKVKDPFADEYTKEASHHDEEE
jgi:hypothetical protein